jgi:hypothetical protein
VASAALVELGDVCQRQGPPVAEKLSVFTVLGRLPAPACGVGTCVIPFCRNAFSEIVSGYPKAAFAGMHLLHNLMGLQRVGM